jgi:hypothetical protein
MLDPPERRPNLCRNGLELLARRQIRIVRAKPKAKAIPSMPRDHVQMDVKDLLPGGFAVRKEQVYALALQRGCAESGGDSLRDDHEMAGSEFLEIRE